ncbi:hypothetical protein L7F22_063637 [Adiantum nelumboides]|nr:hypothetical protein [Adiantum nelumboides]
MGNCCSSSAAAPKPKKKSPKTLNRNADNEANAGVPRVILLTKLTSRGEQSINDKYNLGRELGRGEFGITYLCTERGSQDALACKSISKFKLKTSIDLEDVRREVDIMRHLPTHPNIVSLEGVYEDDDAVHLVMELCEGGELFDRIVARGHYSERAAAVVTRTIVEVVQLCHKHGVIHRDLKPENFLFANKKENSPLKAIDFGLSVFFKPGEKFSEIVGSPYYMAPEVLKRNYGPEVDVWSAGVILYILLCGVPPFWAETEQAVAQAILRCALDLKRDPWPIISENAKSLVRQMLEPDPKKRLTAQQVLDHPWLQNTKKAPDIPLGDVVRARLKQFSAMNKLKKKALRALFENLRTKLDFSSAYHPQTDGQSEIANATVLDLLKCYVSEKQSEWEKYLPLVEFAYNNTIHSTTDEFVCDIDTAYQQVKQTIVHSQEKQKKSADKHRRNLKLDKGQYVLLKFEKARLKKRVGKGKVVKLSNRFYGPLNITDKVNDLTFRLDLPSNWRIHNAFHISLLRPYVGSPPVVSVQEDPPKVDEIEEILQPEQIIHHIERQLKSGRLHRKYLVKFKNYTPLDAKWMTESDLRDYPDILHNYVDALQLRSTV